MDYLVDNGLTKYIGMSNFSVKEMKEAQAHAKHRIAVNQVQYSLVSRNKSTYSTCRNMESEIIPYCQRNNILVMASRPLHKGVFTGAVDALLDELSVKYSRTKAQIALNWLISKKGIVTMPMSTNEEHLRENMGALGWSLDKKDMSRLDGVSVERRNGA
ncbi:MAG: aldo/keto reductase [Candidatus Marsarchaeota archaeon]|jgi:diketogulonate reductase-like aldo/keto reductase|nr:aldo/keto reductase [Candidatus Marsarchaeota archaeon]